MTYKEVPKRDSLSGRMAWGTKSRQWFDREVLPHLPALYQFARQLAGEEEAEDLVQAAVLRAWQHRLRVRPDRSLRPWLFAILRHEWIDQYRRRSRHGEAVPFDSVEGSAAERRDPASLLVEQREGQRVREALNELPEAFRWVVYFRDVEGFEYREIAEILEIPLGTVMSRLSRGRAMLRERLKDLASERALAKPVVLLRKGSNGL